MTNGHLPLEGLSEAQKDELIGSLWDDLRSARTHALALEQRLAQLEGQTADSPLLTQLRERGTNKTSRTQAPSLVKVRLGRGLGFLRSGVVIGAIAFAALAFTTDQGIGWYQSNRQEQKRLAALELQHAAFAGLFVDLIKVAYEGDEKSFRVTMAMTNLEPDRPIYVMLSAMRVFVQAGLVWREVPARAAKAASVVKLTGKHVYETVFEPNVKDWAELMPGYMHVRFENNRLISRRSEPDDDIVERNDRYYVYLKPYGADDEAIRKRMKYPGEPPIFIPMPPH
jgi:hypothetical protein